MHSAHPQPTYAHVNESYQTHEMAMGCCCCRCWFFFLFSSLVIEFICNVYLFVHFCSELLLFCPSNTSIHSCHEFFSASSILFFLQRKHVHFDIDSFNIFFFTYITKTHTISYASRVQHTSCCALEISSVV